jgi:hypothetical protein
MNGEPALGRRRIFIWAALFAWLGLYAGSILTLILTEPTGSGFTRGSNRLMNVLLWQVLAVVPAVLLALQVRGDGFRRPVYWLARVPLLLAALLFGGILILIAWVIVMPAP